MRKTLSVALLIAFANTASANIPLLNANCPGDVSVHADQGGPVYINGKHAKLKRYSNSYYEAKAGNFTASITLSEDGTVSVSYTGKGGANGMCQLVTYHGAPEEGGCPADVSQADRYKYPACN